MKNLNEKTELEGQAQEQPKELIFKIDGREIYDSIGQSLTNHDTSQEKQ